MRRIPLTLSQGEFEIQIKAHEFYCNEFEKRIFPQFSNDVIDKEASAKYKSKEAELMNSMSFTPGTDDSYEIEGIIEEESFESGIMHYVLIAEIRKNVYLAGLAGMYHQWEKGLKYYISSRLSGHISDDERKKIWNKKFSPMCEFLKGAGWDIEKKTFSNLELCNLIVNIYKHGEGTSLDRLKKNNECYLKYLESDSDYYYWLGQGQSLDYKHLSVTSEQFKEFADTILQFWKSFPKELHFTIPNP